MEAHPPSHKDSVAFHEAGHAILVLRSPFRELIEEAKIYCKGGYWSGDVSIRESDLRDAVDPTGALEVAKGLAGPLAQMLRYPESVSPQLADYVRSSGSVIKATRFVLRNDPALQGPWWGDLEQWICFCRRNLFVFEASFCAIEEAVSRFLKEPDVIAVMNEISGRLTREEFIGRDELLAIPVHHLPLIEVPPLEGRVG